MTDEAKAEKIVERLFTNAFKQKAARLVLVDATGRDIGGWGEGPVRDVILAVLKEAKNG